jgi:tetratricopeptide (TPR) repeat protein
LAKQKSQLNALMKKATDAVQRQNYNLAIFNYLQALKLQINNEDVRLALRAIQTRNAKVNGNKPLRMWWATAKATIYAALKKYDKALFVLEEAVSYDPNNVKLLLFLADTALKAGYGDVAIWQRRSIADSVDQRNTVNLLILAELYRDNGQSDQAIKMLEQVKAVDPLSDVDLKMREYSAEVSSRIFGQAVKEGSRSIMKDAGDAERLELDAGKLRTDDQRRKAINYRLANDLKARPKDVAIWTTIGEIAAEMTDFDQGYAEAKKYYEKAQELAPENSAIRDRLGDLEMKRLALAVEAVNDQVKDGDEAAKAQLKELRKQELTFQLGEYERRVKDQPLKGDYHFKLGALYMQFKRYDDAIGELQVSSKDPRWRIKSLTYLGRCMLANGNIDMAIGQFQRAREGVEIFDKYKDPMYYEACAYLQKGDADSAPKALALFTQLYETDIKFRDVKDKVAEAQKAISN